MKKKIITNYFEWLNESEGIKAMVKVFLEALDESIDSLDINKQGKYPWSGIKSKSSFSNLASYKEADADADMKILQEQMNEKGWAWTRVQNLLNSNADEVYDQYEQQTSNALCGLADTYLYLASNKNKLFVLGGIDLPTGEEVLIKFSYGWHKTSYGKLFIEAEYGSIEKWFDAVPEAFVEELNDPIYNNDHKLGTKNDLIDFDVNGDTIVANIVTDETDENKINNAVKYIDSLTNIEISDDREGGIPRHGKLLKVTLKTNHNED